MRNQPGEPGLSQVKTSSDMAPLRPETSASVRYRVSRAGSRCSHSGWHRCHAAKHPDWLYIGASRARAALYLLALEEFPDIPE